MWTQNIQPFNIEPQWLSTFLPYPAYLGSHTCGGLACGPWGAEKSGRNCQPWVAFLHKGCTEAKWYIMRPRVLTHERHHVNEDAYIAFVQFRVCICSCDTLFLVSHVRHAFPVFILWLCFNDWLLNPLHMSYHYQMIDFDLWHLWTDIRGLWLRWATHIKSLCPYTTSGSL